MYKVKNYLLSMQSHWMVNQDLYEAINETIPKIARFKSKRGVEDFERPAVRDFCNELFPEIFSVPLFREEWCEMMLEELDHMKQEIGFEPNQDEDVLRQIPEIVFEESVPELYRVCFFIARNVLDPIFFTLYQRSCAGISSVQIANYNVQDKVQGAWHHDESADISVVVPLNTNGYVGGGTEFHNWGVVDPLPTGHGLIFPSYTNMHRGLPVDSGDRYLLVFWLHDEKRLIDLVDRY